MALRILLLLAVCVILLHLFNFDIGDEDENATRHIYRARGRGSLSIPTSSLWRRSHCPLFASEKVSAGPIYVKRSSPSKSGGNQSSHLEYWQTISFAEDPLAPLGRTVMFRIEQKRSRSNSAILLLSRNQSEENHGGVQKKGLGVESSENDARGGSGLGLHHRRCSSFSRGKGKDSGAYRVLYGSVCAVAFVNAMTYSVIGPFLPAYVSERFGSTSTEVGMVMAAYPAVNLVTSPMVGFLLARIGRWKVLLVGLLTLAISTALYGVAPNVAFLYLASGLHGAALSLVHVGSLVLLSAFPERITESMAGIEVWSGVALVIAPPLGGLVYPIGGVPGVFLLMAAFPVILLFVAPKVKHLVRSAKGDECQAEGTQAALSPWKVSRNRGVIAGVFVTAFNYGVIGFLEVTQAPHLEQTLSTSPRTIGLVLILPNVLYTLAALKAELIVDSIGVKKTLLWGLGLIGASFMLYGPSPALTPALVTRRAAKGAIAFGMLVFQIGSALASVPAFTAMNEGIAGMGPGAEDMIASMHAMSIGVGEVLGPLLGGFAAEHLPTSPTFACDPHVLLKLSDPPIVQDLLVKPSEKGTPPLDVEKLEKQQNQKQRPRTTWGKATATAASSIERHTGEILPLPPSDGDGKPRSNEMEISGGTGDGVVEASEKDTEMYLEVEMTDESRRQLLLGLPGIPFEGGSLKGEIEEGMLIDMSRRHLRFQNSSTRLEDYDGAGDVEGRIEGHTESGGGDDRDGLTRRATDFAVSTAGERRDDGVGVSGIGVGEGDVLSCESSFPLSTTLLAWASCFATLVTYRFLPSYRPALVVDD